MNKSEILAKFSSDPDRYYSVKLFAEQGFERRACVTCGRYFWTCDANISKCPDDISDPYSFIGDPPSTKRLDYLDAWKEIESFFVKNNHTSVNRYPVVCRWRDDLYFTIASIVNFQRIMGGKVSFEFPANPLIIPQPCLRFKDLENVGVTGRHFSSFCMIGQCSISNSSGYWKDECINLDYNLLSTHLGIPKEKIVFVEDVWEGGGSFGSSLEYFVGGLELGNAVFTEFQGTLDNPILLENRIIDMGAGLERFAWLTSGTPTAYDCCFGPVLEIMMQNLGIDPNPDILKRYYTEVATRLDKDIQLAKSDSISAAGLDNKQFNDFISPMESIYLIADHIRTLIFAIADGALPSNVGGGYNLRMMLRRIVTTIHKISLTTTLDDMIDSQIDYLGQIYPELKTRRDDIKKIISIETSRYADSKSRIEKTAQTLRGKTLGIDDMIRLYESDGITPEYLMEMKVLDAIPSTFYTKLSGLHQSNKPKTFSSISIRTTQNTQLLFYGDDPMTFDATVLETVDDFIILDKTSFYARGGGQEPDKGTISELKVVDVVKSGGIILHKVNGDLPKVGSVVNCIVDEQNRLDTSRHHTSTHILNSACRNVLGSWVWQHSAFKVGRYARLDITHHSALNHDEMYKIEHVVNETIQKNLPVLVSEYERGGAEQKYGFGIYQGGVVPVSKVRIVEIENFDVEACGGTHVNNTGEIGLMKITKTERIQDGVVRIEFVAGRHAISYIQKQDHDIITMAQHLDSHKTKILDSFRKSLTRLESTKKNIKIITQNTNQSMAKQIISESKRFDNVGLHITTNSELDSDYFISLGQEVIKQDPTMIYCVFLVGDTVQIIIYSGNDTSFSANDLMKKISTILNGSGGGNDQFAQGGGRDSSKINNAITSLEEILSK